MNLIKKIKRLLLGSYKTAVKEGMHVGKGISVMGGADFGSEPYLITIDDDVRISNNVSFVTHDGGTWVFRDQPEYADVIAYGRIHVGAHTFIGCNSTILPGVTVGKRCVIGAGSVVTKDIPDGCVVAGVPARIIMKTEDYAEKCQKRMAPYDIEAYRADKKNYLQKYVK